MIIEDVRKFREAMKRREESEGEPFKLFSYMLLNEIEFLLVKVSRMQSQIGALKNKNHIMENPEEPSRIK